MRAGWTRARTRRAIRIPGAVAAALLALALAAAGPVAAAASTPTLGPTPAPTAPALARTPTPTAPATPGADASKSSPKDACPDFEFIGARGSGEDNEYDDKTRYTATNPTYGMGGELNDVYQRLAQAAESDGRTITPYGVPYPAVGIDVIGGETLTTGDLSVYTKSVELGAHAAAAELERVSHACPNTGVIVSGYSQGAQAIVDAVLSATPGARASIVAAVFFGNTYFDASDSADDYGSYDPRLNGYLADGSTAPASGIGSDPAAGPHWAKAFDTATIFDYCHDGDPICGLVDERTVAGKRYPVRDFAHIVAADSSGAENPSILTHHTDYLDGDTANAAQQLKSLLGLPLGTAAVTHATLTAPTSTEVGTRTTFNAGGSLSDPADPIISYRWTVDAGTAQQHTATTTSPRYTTTFATARRHTMTLQTTTGSGAKSTAVRTVDVVAAASTTPPEPTQVTETAGDGAVTLSWPNVSGADFYAVSDGSGRLLTAFTPLVPGQSPVSWTDTGLKNGSERQYRVYAVNGMGASLGSALVKATPQAAPQRPVAPPASLPVPNTTLIDPELVWSIGLGVIVVALGLALIKEPPRPRR